MPWPPGGPRLPALCRLLVPVGQKNSATRHYTTGGPAGNQGAGDGAVEHKRAYFKVLTRRFCTAES